MPDDKLDALPTSIRVEHFLAEEEKVFNCLLEHGMKLVPASKFEDVANKTDAFWMTPDGEKLRCAIKVRETKEDILVAVRDPYFGPNDEKTKMGRDMKFEYKFYITRSPDKTQIRVASGKKIHKIINDMVEELSENNWKLERSTPLKSKKHPGCELRLHIDRFSGKPKILGFVRTDYLNKKEIKFIPYHE